MIPQIAPPDGAATVGCMSSLTHLAAIGAVGGIVGALLQARLRAGRYRLADEWARPVPMRRWLCPALAAAWMLLAAHLSNRGTPVVLTYCAAAAWLAALAAVDVDVHRLPDALTLPAYVVAPLLLAQLPAASPGAVRRALLGGVGLGTVYVIGYLAARNRGGVGLGDVKLAVPLGMLLAWIGWNTLAVGAYTGLVVSGITGLLALMCGAGRSHAHAHGPAMALGALVGMCVGG